MEEHLRQALEIVKAQASVRKMSEEEIMSMVTSLTTSLKGIADGDLMLEENAQTPAIDPKKAIKEKSIICMECGKSFKVLTKRHLALHGISTDEYKAKWGYKKTQSLVAKSLARERRKKMQEMRLWEKRGKK